MIKNGDVSKIKSKLYQLANKESGRFQMLLANAQIFFSADIRNLGKGQDVLKLSDIGCTVKL